MEEQKSLKENKKSFESSENNERRKLHYAAFHSYVNACHVILLIFLLSDVILDELTHLN